MHENETKKIMDCFQKIIQRGHDASKVFHDWIDLMIYALCGDEKKYLEVVNRYNNDRPRGEREIDFFANMFGELMIAMKKTNKDLLGEIYQTRISRGHHGQFFTPEHITDMMAEMVGPGKKGDLVADFCCGSGRMLISASRINPERIFVGKDFDQVCAKMMALNMCFFNMDGYAICGDGLTDEQTLLYQIRRTALGGDIRELEPYEIKFGQLKKQDNKKITLKDWI